MKIRFGVLIMQFRSYSTLLTQDKVCRRYRVSIKNPTSCETVVNKLLFVVGLGLMDRLPLYEKK